MTLQFPLAGRLIDCLSCLNSEGWLAALSVMDADNGQDSGAAAGEMEIIVGIRSSATP